MHLSLNLPIYLHTNSMGLQQLLVLLIIMLMVTRNGRLHALGGRHGSHFLGHHTFSIKGREVTHSPTTQFAVFIKDYAAPRANAPKSNTKLPNGH
ncbi:hypothetical protein KP509_18G001600 [Ceratopteris richardii]|uniref:Uncharacterized protein n=1 Tax=Ceratopteris richardii TaxID=49495 RepID=A0A8T2SQP5_CERRI|nr:hypothetical protein KP509_18G001600 [Ceratopteris richardii]